MLARLSLALVLVFSAGAALAADPVQGEWLVQDGKSKVTIGPCKAAAEKVCGAISWLKDPADAAKTDTKNPDPALRSKPIKGLQILWDFKQAGPGRWTGGKIYDPHDGKTYKSKLAVSASGALKVDGCVLMICQAQTWTR
jgi:uncharacterized protein (DUF2147 family)